MLIEQVGSRLAGTCDVNRASGQSVVACLVEYFREVVAEYFQHFDENASLKPPWLGEERVRNFIDFSCNRT